MMEREDEGEAEDGGEALEFSTDAFSARERVLFECAGRTAGFLAKRQWRKLSRRVRKEVDEMPFGAMSGPGGLETV